MVASLGPPTFHGVYEDSLTSDGFRYEDLQLTVMGVTSAWNRTA